MQALEAAYGTRADGTLLTLDGRMWKSAFPLQGGSDGNRDVDGVAWSHTGTVQPRHEHARPRHEPAGRRHIPRCRLHGRQPACVGHLGITADVRAVPARSPDERCSEGGDYFPTEGAVLSRAQHL